MGVDPGLVATGFGVLEAGPGGVTVVDAGVISTSTGQVLEARLNAIYRAVHRLIEAHAPSLLIVEDLYTEYKFPRTAVLMGHARGVIYLAARQLEVPLLALTPSEVKRGDHRQWRRGQGPGAARGANPPRPCERSASLAHRRCARARGHRNGAPDRAHSLGPGDRGAWRPAGCPPERPPERPMIASVRGRLRRRFEDRVVVEAAGVGYEVFIPPVVQRALADAVAGDGDGADEVLLMVHYHATQNQPRPVLIGFTSDLDKEFFEKLITVKDVGPLVAARSLAAPVAEIAAAIARQDEAYLRRMPGIGPQKAKNIVAQLQAKVAKFALAQRRSRGSGEARSGRAPARGRRGPQDPGLRGAREAARPPAE